MNRRIFIGLLFTAAAAALPSAVLGQVQIQVNASSAQQEADYIWRNLQDISFFDQNGYQVAFPDHPFMEELLEAARAGTLQPSDFDSLQAVMTQKIYQDKDYEKGLQAVNEQLDLLRRMIGDLSQLQLDWDFKLFETYQVQLTLYGPGGSYDPDEGSILLFTTSSGQFKQYDNPANTLIHEVVHMGIQASLIDHYQVPHAFKERIVDNFVLLNFSELLPDYRLQQMGDERADRMMQTLQDLRKLDQQVSTVLHEGK